MDNIITITIISINDWAGLYVNEDLRFEDHTLDLVDLQYNANHRPFYLTLLHGNEALKEYVNTIGNFPETLREAMEIK